MRICCSRICLAVRAQELNERTQRCQVLPPAWIIQKEPFGRRRHPRLEQGDELPAGNHWRSVFRQSVNDACAIHRGPGEEIGIAGDQRTFDLELLNFAVDDEPPRQELAAWKAQADTIVRVKVLGLFRRRMPREVLGRSGDDKPQGVSHAHGDHVAADAVADTETRVVTAGDDIGQCRTD